MSATLHGKDAVLAEMGQHPAISAVMEKMTDALTDARWDREELTLTIAPEKLVPVAGVIRQAGYNFLEDVTAVDWFPAQEPRFQVSYHLLSHARKERIRLRVMLAASKPEVETITDVWPSANYYEREVFDLFGVHFAGHPNLRRILMPDEWTGHPLRKDYPVEGYR